VVVDITELQHMEERLHASLHEKEVLLKEIHHRVKNNLRIVSSLLDLQADALPDPQVRSIFEDSQQRIQAMALIHESLYQSEDLAPIDAASYIQRLCTRLGQARHLVADRIPVAVRVEAVRLGVGFPETLDFRTADFLGLQLVCLLTEQLQGTITLTRHEGTEWTLTFPLAGPSTREEEDHGPNSHRGR
jgi:two-component sensor histidine kinase